MGFEITYIMKNVTTILTVVLLTFSTSLQAQLPWEADTIDYNHLDEEAPAQFSDKPMQLNATRYYQFGRDTERN
jgi:hypothetical protein